MENVIAQKRVAEEKESKELQDSIINYWDKYINSSIEIFLSLDTP
jgi:hypothetical protein